MSSEKLKKPTVSFILKKEIMNYNYWEHYKFEKDIAMVLPIDHPKRINMRKATQELLEEIHKLSE